jgi:hypothetical protein
MGKEDLFFRWIEIVEFETSKPGGFTHEKQEAVAEQIRELFQSNGVDFDKVWREVFAKGFINTDDDNDDDDGKTPDPE